MDFELDQRGLAVGAGAWTAAVGGGGAAVGAGPDGALGRTVGRAWAGAVVGAGAGVAVGAAGAARDWPAPRGAWPTAGAVVGSDARAALEVMVARLDGMTTVGMGEATATG